MRIIVLSIALAIASGSVALAGQAGSSVIHLDDAAKLYEVFGHAEILDDPNGSLDIDDVTHSSAFRPGPEDGQPADDGVRWYRFRAVTPSHSDAQWYLGTIVYCSSADLYVPRGGGLYSLHPFGYGVPFQKHPAPGNSPMIALPLLTGQPLYVRLQCYRGLQWLYMASERNADLAGNPIADVALTALIPLIVLAFGLASVTRSRAFLLVAVSGTFWGMREGLTYHAARWFPTVALPPIVTIFQLTDVAFFVASFLFYDEFFDLRRKRRRVFLCFLAVTALTLITLGGSYYLPLRISVGPYQLGFIAFYTVAAGIGILVARSGNRSAWFVAGGASLFDVADMAQVLSSWLPSWMSWFLPFANPADMILFILGVGDQLRQVSLAHQTLLEEKGVAQTQLVSAQEERIADVERRNESFARFVPAEFLRQLDRRDIIDVRLGDHAKCDMAILFSDIRGFTAIAENLSPGETFEFLNDYLARAGPVIRAHGGFIDKYVGDAIVALFSARPSGALDAAIALQREVRRFNEDRAQKDSEPIAVGIGVHFGSVMLGTIGEVQRVETTVIADAVNVASRLEGMTKVVGAPIIASAEIVDALDDPGRYCLRPIGEIALRGKTRAIIAFEVFDGDPHELLLHKRRTRDTFEAALDAYRRSAYDRSRELFGDIAAADPYDRVAAYLRDRSTALGSSLVALDGTDSWPNSRRDTAES